MKKLYTLLLAASLATGLSAATFTGKKHFDASKLGELKTWEQVKSEMETRETMRATSTLKKAPAAAPQKVATPTPADADALCALPWDASYQGIIQSNSGLHEGTATFTYYADDEELYVKMPDYGMDLYTGGYSDGTLTISHGVSYGSNANGDIVLCPINATTGAMLTSADVSVPFNAATGEFEFPSTFAWGLCAVKNNAAAGFYWAGKSFTLKVSEGDFSIKATTNGDCNPDNLFNVTLTRGADVASVKMMVLPFDTDANEVQDYFESLGEDVTENEFSIAPATRNSLGGPMEESGNACAVFAAYDKDGNLKRTANLSVIVNLEKEEGWKNVGEAEYTDPVVCNIYNNFSHTQTAMLQQNEENPAIFRYVNAYSTHKYAHSTNCNHYIILNTTDKDWVEMPFSSTGLDFGDGVLTIGSCAALNYNKEDGTAAGMSSGTMSGQTITFPAQSLFSHETGYNDPGAWSYANSKVAATFTLPDITLDLTVVTTSDEPIEGATVKVGANEATTDAAGKASLTVPFETGYFGVANVSATKGDNTESTDVNLTGTKTTFTFKSTISGILSISTDAAASEAEYFNLQGVRIANPAEGQLVIRRQGTKVEKVIL